MLTGNLKYLDMLKRYRNGVFHYQATFQHTFTKQMGLLAEEDIGRWLAVLHEEFCRVYWEIVQRAPSPPDFAPIRFGFGGLDSPPHCRGSRATAPRKG